MQHVIRILFIEGDPLVHACMATVIRENTPQEIACMLETAQTHHQAIHLLLGYDEHTVPDLIVTRDPDQISLVPRDRDMCCHELLELSLRDLIQCFGADIPILIARERTDPKPLFEADKAFYREHPIRCDLLKKVYLLFLRRLIAP